MPDWIGTRLSADINLGAQLAMLVGLWIGFYFAHTGRIRKHRNTQTTMVLTNMVFIVFLSVTAFGSSLSQGAPPAAPSQDSRSVNHRNYRPLPAGSPIIRRLGALTL